MERKVEILAEIGCSAICGFGMWLVVLGIGLLLYLDSEFAHEAARVAGLVFAVILFAFMRLIYEGE